MALTDIVLARLVRPSPQSEITLQERQHCNAADGPAGSLFEQARATMNRSASRQYGFFDPDSEHRDIVGLINNWQGGSLDFAAFARRAGKLLQHQLQEAEAGFSTVLLAAHESVAGINKLYFFWLPEVEIIQAGGDLEPGSGHMIAADKVQYGMCLDLHEWQDGESPKYLCYFGLRGNKPLSEAFERFINFRQGLDTTEQTRTFLNTVEEYSRELPEEQSQPVKSAILDYCLAQDKVGQPVDIKTLSGELDQSAPDRFAEFVRQRQADQEIHTDRQSLKRYMRYFGRDNSLSISFSAERIGKDIVYDAQAGTLHIHRLPGSLKAQLGDSGKKNE